MRAISSLFAAGLIAAAAPASAQAGADVIVGSIPNISNYGASGGTAAYALGTTSCNVGTAELLWFANSNQHPVIGQNIYRIENGRFEQIGTSWLKHGFTALQQNLCGNCQSSGTGSRLGVGCSDPYSSGLNGSQGGLGPRFQVNAFTGAFPYPYFQQGQSGDRIFKRIQVANDDVDPSLHPTATYWGEAQYVAPDDAAAGNGVNNNSYVRLNRPGSTTQGGWRLSVGGSTVRELAAIYAWGATDSNVNITEINIPSEGQFVAGSNVVDNGDGTWNYEYAIFNNNSHFSGQRFSVAIGDSAVTDIGMSFAPYHSGEPYTNTPWSASVNGGLITWECETASQNTNANALRWGSTYSFWFRSSAPPASRVAELGLFRGGNPGPQLFTIDGPNGQGGNTVFTSNYCNAALNSQLFIGQIGANNIDLSARTFDIEVSNLPPNQFGMVITSLTDGFVPNPGFSAGNLCVVGNIGRTVGGIFNSGGTGATSVAVDMDMVPSSTNFVSILAGETRYFQAWHRDLTGLGTPTSNYTLGLRMIFP